MATINLRVALYCRVAREDTSSLEAQAAELRGQGRCGAGEKPFAYRAGVGHCAVVH